MSQVVAINDKLLTNVSLGLFQADMDYISESVLPTLKVAQNTGKIGSYGKSHLRILNSVMGGKGMAPRIHTSALSSSSYLIESHGLEDVITKDDYRNFEAPFDAESDSVKFLMSLIWLGKEKALADSLMSTSVITNYTTLSGTNQFSDYNNSSPLDKFKTARTTVRANSGKVPNSVVMDWKVFETLRYHPEILENLGFTKQRAGQMSASEMASAMDVQNLFVGKAVYNSSVEGQSDSLAAIWGTGILFYYAPSAPTLRDQSLGFLIESTSGARKVYKYSVNNPPEANAIIVQNDYDQLVTDVNCAYLIDAAIA